MIRKLLFSFHLSFNGTAHLHTPPPSFPSLPSSSLPRLLSPSPSPSPSPSSFKDNLYERERFFFPTIPVAKSVFDITTLSAIAGLLLLSLIAFSFIFHLRFRSRRLYHLQNFNSLWTVRLLLVAFASLWTINEILRLPFVRRNYLYPFLPTLTIHEQANLCKIHVVLSLGLFEPGFLVTLLFLVNVSIRNKKPCRMWAILFVCMFCSPITFLQTVFVVLSPLEAQMPKFMHGSSILANDLYGNRTVLCTYPFFSCVIFTVFAIAYALAFLLSCWRVLAFVINKSIRVRINSLVTAVMVALPLRILCLGLTLVSRPEKAIYGVVVLVMFLCVAASMVVGEFILVIRPIADALAAGGECCRWVPNELRQQGEDRKQEGLSP